jgi:hypothetical protein
MSHHSCAAERNSVSVVNDLVGFYRLPQEASIATKFAFAPIREHLRVLFHDEDFRTSQSFERGKSIDMINVSMSLDKILDIFYVKSELFDAISNVGCSRFEPLIKQKMAPRGRDQKDRII